MATVSVYYKGFVDVVVNTDTGTIDSVSLYGTDKPIEVEGHDGEIDDETEEKAIQIADSQRWLNVEAQN